MDGLSADQVNLLKRFARRYIWWRTPGESLRSPDRILLQIMEIGEWEDCLAIMNGFPRERLVEAVRAGTAGTLSPKSWNFWHIRLYVGEPGKPPPPPRRDRMIFRVVPDRQHPAPTGLPKHNVFPLGNRSFLLLGRAGPRHETDLETQAWGEMILSNILERSGLREGEEYETQAHRTGTDGERLRPDVVVRIPGGKSLVVDSKVSLVAYTDAVNAETEEEATAARKRHVASIRAHINGLSGKAYQAAEELTVDYVILFVPIEGALSEALREDGALTEYALERHVTIATPTTLMMALRTVSHVWAVERRNRNAEEIAKRAGLLYDKVAGFVSSMEGVGTRLRQAQDSYDAALGQLSQGSGNLLRQAEMLKALGAKTTKSIGMGFEETGALPPPDAPPAVRAEAAE